MRSATWMILGTLLVGCGRDVDGDGFRGKDDCDDENSDIYPGAAESCDGIDNDCDQAVDEGLLLTWYADTDADTYGDPEASIEACVLPDGYVANSDDCNDESDAFYPGAPEDDCVDKNDYNCDGSVGYDDLDGDGIAACEGDCDDSDPLINENADEVCDGVDNDCDGDTDQNAIDAPLWYLDHDGDSYGDPAFVLELCNQPANYVENADDCDDLNDGIYPGADEYCDLEDNDCDSVIDEDDAVDVAAWYADSDGDGHGDPKVSVEACPDALGLGPKGHVDNAADCDDTDEQISPEADEICDEADNNCDGVTDEDAVDAPLWFIDGDSDGYGAATSSQTACTQPKGYADNSTDCNDGNTAINPGATEICDGIDNDCDSATDDEDDSVDSSSTGTTWYADSDGDGFGDADATTQACYQPSGYVSDDEDCDDSNGDTNPDAVEVCDDGIDNNCDEVSSACELELSADADISAFYGTTTGEGTYALAHSDINDDGTEDIIIGAYNAANGVGSSADGASYVFYGPFTAELSLTDADLTITGRTNEKDTFGVGAFGLDDFDGDGVDDFAIASSQMDNDALSSGSNAGGIFVFSGADVVTESTLDSEDAGIVLLGEGKQQYLGAAIVGGEDVNGDGLMDLLAGASWAPDRSTAEGSVYLVYGGLSSGTYTISDVAQARLDGEDANDKIGVAGTTAMVGDMNGDGDVDFVLGAYLHNSETGAAYLVAGPVSGEQGVVDAAAAKMVPDSAGDYAGRGVSPAGDVNGDGYEDVWIASPREDTGASAAGAVFLIHGAASLGDYDESNKGVTLDSVADFTIYGTLSSDQIGAVLDGTGDMDGDGNNDLLIGQATYGSFSEGAAFFFYGPLSGSSKNTSEADAIFVGSNSADSAGSNVRFVGDVNGSGTDSVLIDVPEDDNNASSTSNAGAAYLVFDFGL